MSATSIEQEKSWPMHFPTMSLDGVLAWIKRKEVIIGFVIGALMLFLYNEVAVLLSKAWIDPDSHYQHGPAIPFAVAYILWTRREKIEKTPIKPVWWLLPIFIGIGVIDVFFSLAHFIDNAHVNIFYVAFLVLVCMIYGFRRFWAMSPALLYVTMGLPLWHRFIDDNTNQLQIWSTSGAYQLLELSGFEPLRTAPTVVHLNNFELNIAEACSGMKLTLALIATTLFIMLVARLRWWANLILLVLTLPLAVAMNSLRIALIGIFGDSFGHDAGFWFHDYGSYGTLILAFWLLYIAAKKLGWNV
jgi:exosortase